VYHHESLEFRAKVFALVIASNEQYGDCEEIILHHACNSVYNEDEVRAKILAKTTNEYLLNYKQSGNNDIEKMLLSVDESIKENHKLTSKIDINMLKEFLECCENNHDRKLQSKVIEFLEDTKLHKESHAQI